MDPFKITVVNIESNFGEFRQNLKNHFKWIEQHKDSDLILFPELSLSGYSSCREELTALKKESTQIVKEFCSRTTDYPEISIAMGSPDFRNRKIYIVQYLIRNGKIIHSHTKRVLGPSEKKCFSSGGKAKTLKDYEIRPECRVGIGIQVCAETHSPESSARLADRGAGILLMPFASPRETGEEKITRLKKYLPARAYDNSCFLACCNLIRKGRHTGMAPGAAMIIGPRGEILSETAGPGESSCSALIPLAEIHRIKSSTMGWFRSWKNIRG